MATYTEWRHTRNGDRVSPFSVCRHSMRSVQCMATRDPITCIISFSSQSKVVWVMFIVEILPSCHTHSIAFFSRLIMDGFGGLHTATQLVLEPLKSYPFLSTTPIPPLVRPCFFGTPAILPNYAVPFCSVRRPAPEHFWKRVI